MPDFTFARIPVLIVGLAAFLAPSFSHAGTEISTASKPGAKWVQRPTRQLTDLPALQADQPLDRFGGQPSKLTAPSGFFQTRKIDGRWWLITPEGGLFISRGVNSVSEINTRGAKAELKKKFGTPEAWSSQTLGLLRDRNFNTTGAWSDATALRNPGLPMAQTLLWSFMSSYGKKRGGTRQDAGHTGYPNDCPFIFDPEFETFCESYARRIDAYQNDPWIIGHFSDNEMPWSRKMLENYLALPAGDPGQLAAAGWLKERGVSASAITAADRSAFLEFAIDRYLEITGAAIRKHAPHHLFLGPRLHETVFDAPEVFTAFGRHVDVVCVNYYRAWSPSKKSLQMWHGLSGKPLMITEFYAKSEDSGLANTGGAGWLVKTQKDRGAFYQNFTLGLIESKVCIGWSWHRYADNDPEDKSVDPSNRDSNKGIVSNRYAPFTELLDSMKSINERVYGIADYYDRGNP